MKIQGVPQLHPPPSTAKTLEDIYLNNNSVGKLLLSNEILTQYRLCKIQVKVLKYASLKWAVAMHSHGLKPCT